MNVVGEFDLIQKILTTFSPKHFEKPFEKSFEKPSNTLSIGKSVYGSNDPIIIDNKEIILNYERHYGNDCIFMSQLQSELDHFFVVFFDPTDESSIKNTQNVRIS